jgi:undecaprenyl-diphosphatase
MSVTSIAPDDVTSDEPRFEEDTLGYKRSASDLLRFVVYGLTAVALLALTRWAENAVLGLESDVLELLNFLDPPAERVLEGTAEVLAVIVQLGVLATPIVLRRYRLLAYVILGNLLASLAAGAAVEWLDREVPQKAVNELAKRAGVRLDEAFTPAALAALAASFVILAPFVGRRWRRAGAVILGVFVLLQLVLSVQLSGEVFFALAVGAATGCAVLLAFGRPDQHPTAAAIASSLAASGLTITGLDPTRITHRGERAYYATSADGSRLFVKIISPEERSADILYRVYRYLRFKNAGDERPFSSLRRAVEHEALVALQARDVEVRTPRMRAISDVGTDSMLIAFDAVDAASLSTLADDDITDDLLRRVWQLVAHLREHRIAHRNVKLANVLVDAHGDPWLVDFGFSEIAASDALLDADVAQLLASTAVHVGSARAVDNALAVLGEDTMRSALRFLQPNALGTSTRADLRHHKGLLKELQHTVEERCHVSEPEFVQLARIDKKLLFTIVLLVAVTYFLIPQFSDLPGIVDQVKDADWVWIGPVLVGSLVTYVGATLAVTGSVPDRLRFAPTFLAQVAASFAGTLAPASVGGLALNARYLQKSGVDPPVAVSGVGLNAVAGIAMHIALLGLFVVWGGSSAFGSFKLPDPEIFLIGIGVVLVLAVVVLAIPATRHAIGHSLLPILRRSLSGLGGVLRRPVSLALLLGGSVLVTVGYMFSMYFATLAFDGDLTFVQVGAIYLAASAVAAAAPTPGGLGALEAAVISGLVAAGMDNAIAVPAVFFFRLATFWMPILPGYICFHWMQREEYL